MHIETPFLRFLKLLISLNGVVDLEDLEYIGKRKAFLFCFCVEKNILFADLCIEINILFVPRDVEKNIFLR